MINTHLTLATLSLYDGERSFERARLRADLILAMSFCTLRKGREF